MGEPKAAADLAGRPLIAYPVEAVEAAGLEALVVAKPDSPLPDLGCRVVHDAEAALHPAAGIVAALRAAAGEPIVVLACDMPFVPPDLIDFLAGLDAAVAVPRVNGRLQPLLARYGPSAVAALEDALGRGAALRRAVADLDPLIVDEAELARFGDPGEITANVNDRTELTSAERLLARGTAR
jgi:molybdopterin-guanine dinucleotide biosynthesis protein A